MTNTMWINCSIANSNDHL